jgi:P27 family predicted phage terminase small subunit
MVAKQKKVRKVKRRADEKNIPDAGSRQTLRKQRIIKHPGTAPVVLSGFRYELPDTLDPRDKLYLQDIAEELTRSRVGGKLDSFSFSILVDIVGQYRKQLERANAKDWFWTTKANQIAFTPEVRLLNDTRERLVYMLAEFGLTPSARTRVRVVYDTEELPARHPDATRDGVLTPLGQKLKSDFINGINVGCVDPESLKVNAKNDPVAELGFLNARRQA